MTLGMLVVSSETTNHVKWKMFLLARCIYNLHHFREKWHQMLFNGLEIHHFEVNQALKSYKNANIDLFQLNCSAQVI